MLFNEQENVILQCTLYRLIFSWTLLLLLPFILCSSFSIANQLSLWLFLYFSISLGSIIIYGRYKDIPHNLDGVLHWVLLLLLLFPWVLLLALLTTTAGVTVVAFCFDKQIIVYHKSIVSAHSFDDGIVWARQNTLFHRCEILSQKYEIVKAVLWFSFDKNSSNRNRCAHNDGVIAWKNQWLNSFSCILPFAFG